MSEFKGALSYVSILSSAWFVLICPWRPSCMHHPHLWLFLLLKYLHSFSILIWRMWPMQFDFSLSLGNTHRVHYNIYSSSRWAWMWKDWRKHFKWIGVYLYFFLQIQIRNEEVLYSCPYQECSVRDKQKDHVNFPPNFHRLTFKENVFSLVLSNLNILNSWNVQARMSWLIKTLWWQNKHECNSN